MDMLHLFPRLRIFTLHRNDLLLEESILRRLMSTAMTLVGEFVQVLPLQLILLRQEFCSSELAELDSGPFLFHPFTLRLSVVVLESIQNTGTDRDQRHHLDTPGDHDILRP